MSLILIFCTAALHNFTVKFRYSQITRNDAHTVDKTIARCLRNIYILKCIHI